MVTVQLCLLKTEIVSEVFDHTPSCTHLHVFVQRRETGKEFRLFITQLLCLWVWFCFECPLWTKANTLSLKFKCVCVCVCVCVISLKTEQRISTCFWLYKRAVSCREPCSLTLSIRGSCCGDLSPWGQVSAVGFCNKMNLHPPLPPSQILILSRVL